MVHFDTLEQQGVTVAGLSGLDDGDCGWSPRTDGQRAAYLRRCGLEPAHLVSVRQVHGSRVAVVSDADRGCGANMDALVSAPVADGMITDVPGLPLGIMVADCVPVYLVAPGAIGLVHAGRKGTRQGISRSAVNALVQHFGAAPETLWALVGPSAGPCCYEVSEEMARDWRGKGLPARGCFLDLWETNRRQLIASGVPEGQIQVSGCCTICGTTYHSYRRDGGTGRNLAVLCR